MPSKLRNFAQSHNPLTIKFGAGVPVAEDIAPLILDAISRDSWIETYRVIVFAEITKTSAATTVAMLQELTSNSAKAKQIQAGIKPNLSEIGYKVVCAVLELADRCLANRNLLAHSLLGTVNDLKDKLLLMAPQSVIGTNATIKFKFAHNKLTLEDGMERFQTFLDKALVYTKSDIQTMIEEMKYVQAKLEYLDTSLQAPTQIRELGFETLASESQIRAILQREKQKVSPDA